jgi:hypothetical protein
VTLATSLQLSLFESKDCVSSWILRRQLVLDQTRDDPARRASPEDLMTLRLALTGSGVGDDYF